MREPVVRVELNPERREHVEERRLFVIAVRVFGVAGLAVAVVARRAVGLRPREQHSADDLWIRRHQRQAAALAILRELIEAAVRERARELHVATEQSPGRSHQRVARVVADAGELAVANELAGAVLFAGAADCLVVRIRRRQPHLGPRLDRGAVATILPGDVLLKRARVVEQVELDELDALVLEIDERAVDAAQILRRPERLGLLVARSPVVRPIDPRNVAKCDGLLAAAALCGVVLDLAEETRVARCRDGSRAGRDLGTTADEVRCVVANPTACGKRKGGAQRQY